jgi:uncharacterized protein (TIGR03118 family)
MLGDEDSAHMEPDASRWEFQQLGAEPEVARLDAVELTAPGSVAGAAGAGTFRQENLVSDQPGVATLTNPNLVNPWGMSRGANSPVWVSDNGADVSTLYRGDTAGAPVSIVPLVVSIPGGAPTGQVFNDTTAFVVPGTGRSAAFIFAGEDGDLSAWNGGAAAVAVGHTDGAVYKGLALVHGLAGPRLLAANFHDNRIDVFDGQFTLLPDTGMFREALGEVEFQGVPILRLPPTDQVQAHGRRASPGRPAR